jgi:hypothetical protein
MYADTCLNICLIFEIMQKQMQTARICSKLFTMPREVYEEILNP